MRKTHRAIVVAAMIALCVAFWGCEDPASWAPRGEVTFLDLKESIDGRYAKTGTLDYSIRNCGKSRISASVVALTYSTDRGRYHCTVVDENGISPGALIYGQVSITYSDPDEAGALTGAVVDSMQFR